MATRQQAGQQRRRAVSTTGLVLAGAAAVGAVAGIAATAATMVAKVVVTPPRGRVEDIRVEQYWETPDGAFLKLAGTADARLAGDPGIYSFWFDDDAGHARLGEIVDQSWDTVTRRVLKVDRGDLARTKRGRINGWVWTGAGDLEYPFREISVSSTEGENPAWWIPAPDESSDTWAIHIHGRGSQKTETLRGVPVMERLGFHSLVISYRNDGEAAPSADGKYGLGDTEWLDVEAAMRFAMDHGAKRIVLVGWSMGGAIALQAADRSKLAHTIVGIVLDSPVVDWEKALRYQSDAVSLPRPVQNAVLAILSRPWGRYVTGLKRSIRFDRLNWVRRPGDLSKPTLIMHSDDDGYVPCGPSRELAAARPDLVTYVPFERARHCKLWNYDAPRWEGSVERWVAQLPGLAER